MRRLILWEIATLDGFCAAEKDDDPFFELFSNAEIQTYSVEQNQTVGTLLFGRKTYEGMAGYWQTQEGAVADFMNRIPKIVFSRTLTKTGWANSTLEKGDPVSAVSRLKEGSGKDIFVFGSLTLASYLSAAGIVDEYRLGIAPIYVGRGRNLLQTLRDPLQLKHVEARTLGPGLLLLRLAPVRSLEQHLPTDPPNS